jgi:perosamine synthetase
MKKILFAKPSITQKEIDYVNDAITNGWGDECYTYLNNFKEKLKEYFDVPYVWPTSSCHGALHILLMALEIGKDDEVIVPDMTWIGSVSPISWLGGTPVFVDVLEDSWCIDPNKIVDAITKKTKAIIVVHPYGNIAEMDEIIAIGKKYGIPIIEDAAEAVGSEYKGRKVGSIADFGVISMHGTKMLTTGEGGAILCNREDLVEKIAIIEGQGRRPKKHIHFWVDEIGLKYKMSNLQAALGLAQFERADEIVDKKRQIFDWYKELLQDVEDIALNPEPEGTKNCYWQPTVIFGETWNMSLESRNTLIDQMNEKYIALRPLFYPVSMFPMYEDCLNNKVSYNIFRKGINLPSYFEMTKDDVSYVIKEIQKMGYLQKRKV